MYVFSEKSTSHAISRSTYREIGKGDLVQLNLSAKIEGYSPSVGMPISMGPLVGEKRELVEFGLDMHRWTYKQLKAGVEASSIAQGYYQRFIDLGRKDNFVYGPCHGTGMIEVEAPWMESSSTYKLQPNMTFQVDTFASGPSYGLRWETGVAITEDGYDLLSNPIGEIYEIDC
jgi:Xaa-Pro aminopeptidase